MGEPFVLLQIWGWDDVNQLYLKYTCSFPLHILVDEWSFTSYLNFMREAVSCENDCCKIDQQSMHNSFRLLQFQRFDAE